MRNILLCIFLVASLLPLYAGEEETPAYGVKIERLVLPHHYPYLNGKIDYDILIRNTGSQTIRNLYVHTEISNGCTFDRNVALSNALLPGKTAYATVRYVPNPEPGVYLLTSRIDRVNDNIIDTPAVEQAIVAAYDDGYELNALVEVSTSTSEGKSPAEKVLLGRIKKYRPNWVRVAVHRDDPMADASFDDFAEKLTDKVPGVSINRNVVSGDIEDVISDLDSLQTVFSSYPSYAYLSLDAVPDTDREFVRVNASVQFSYPTDFEHRLAFAVVEDGVGPYDQTNSYAGGAQGKMGGWENNPGVVHTSHNDVGRHITGFDGIEGSLPEYIQPGRVYEYSVTLPVGNVSHDMCRIVGMIINSWNGEVVNASQIQMSRSGVDSVTDDALPVRVNVLNGSIEVSGADTFEVYSPAGNRVAATGLSTGIYIVRVNGETYRVIVR